MAGASLSVSTLWQGERLARAQYEAGRRGALRAAERLRALSLPLAPLDLGPLRESATVDAPTIVPEAFVTYDTPYAVIQHEALDFHHEDGQAKYLETPLHENSKELVAIMAKEVRVGILNA